MMSMNNNNNNWPLTVCCGQCCSMYFTHDSVKTYISPFTIDILHPTIIFPHTWPTVCFVNVTICFNLQMLHKYYVMYFIVTNVLQ